MVMQNFGENFVEWKPNEKLFRLLKQPLRSGIHSFIESKHIYICLYTNPFSHFPILSTSSRLSYFSLKIQNVNGI